MSLQAARIEFTRCLGKLLAFGEENGFALMLDESKRGKQQAEWNATHCGRFIDGVRCERTRGVHGMPAVQHPFIPVGIQNSVHTLGLAVDLYIMVDGQISNDFNSYATLGGCWKAMHGLARWGGDFKNLDLGHFSFEWGGRK